MAKTQPKLINSGRTKKGLTVEITEQKAMYAVMYEGKFINARDDYGTPDISKRYQRTTYGEKGRCVALAEKLNQMFGTDKYQAVMVQPVIETCEDVTTDAPDVSE
ncbi:hypothetical protein [Caballeronia zhejiangensis]|uniref:hypothetical protein n=1 Tax=Caballeronia zhejiangensis TaxID=871203 RepID=UPI001F5206DC|nr:hypothetical protein [Caballeronia zhejiangensis]MCI1046936.1 hypothetical protein [Caballeronia zhejiangensis]